MTDEAWMRLGGLIRDRREQLGMTQLELGIASNTSEPTVRAIETARRSNFQRSTLRALCLALGWTSTSIEAVLDGGDPVVWVPAIEVAPHDPSEILRRIAELEAKVGELIVEKEAEERAAERRRG